MTKTRVAILRGGPSSEYDVSLNTGESVLSSIDREKYDPVDVFIDKQGIWHVGGLPKQPKAALSNIDIAFNALHGKYGEDGKIQKLLEDLGMPYTGSGVVPSAIAMNKEMTKKSLASSGIKFAHHKMLTREELLATSPHELFKIVSIPAVVKPVGSGSSVGVTIVKSFADLESALSNAFAFADQIMIEEYISGREATVGVVDRFRGRKFYALPPIEILPAVDFYDYSAKYTSTDTRYACPSDFPEDVKSELERLAVLVHKTLGLSDYSRSDFIVHPKRGIYFLEVNTLPGMTTHSLVPKALTAIGSSLPEFIDHVITIAKEGK